MDFSSALGQIKGGTMMRRTGWQGWVSLVTSQYWALGIALPFAASVVSLGAATAVAVGTATLAQASAPSQPVLNPFLVIKNDDGSLEPWVATQSDLLATDWEVAT